MVTGDHYLTATAVAKGINIITTKQHVLLGIMPARPPAQPPAQRASGPMPAPAPDESSSAAPVHTSQHDSTRIQFQRKQQVSFSALPDPPDASARLSAPVTSGLGAYPALGSAVSATSGAAALAASGSPTASSSAIAAAVTSGTGTPVSAKLPAGNGMAAPAAGASTGTSKPLDVFGNVVSQQGVQISKQLANPPSALPDQIKAALGIQSKQPEPVALAPLASPSIAVPSDNPLLPALERHPALYAQLTCSIATSKDVSMASAAQAFKAIAEGMQCVVTGSVFDFLLEHAEPAVLETILRGTVVWARMKSHQKAQLVNLLGTSGLTTAAGRHFKVCNCHALLHLPATYASLAARCGCVAEGFA